MQASDSNTLYCVNDIFDFIDPNIACLSNPPLFRYLKYRFVDDTLNEELYNFPRVREECRQLNSTLWEILDGRDEWEAVMEMAKDMRRGQLWINAR